MYLTPHAYSRACTPKHSFAPTHQQAEANSLQAEVEGLKEQAEVIMMKQNIDKICP